ncbi:MAG: DUF6483 family protein [Sphaerobacter sp.]|nr:DUF6483 family protein [Sphaerobacter sp.]
MATLLREAADLRTADWTPAREYGRRVKALALYLLILRDEDPDAVHAVAGVDELLAQLRAYELPSRVRDELWQHFARRGQYAKAEDWLFTLVEDPEAPADLLDRGVAFYLRLSAASDADLLAGALPREEVAAGLAELHAIAASRQRTGERGSQQRRGGDRWAADSRTGSQS